MPAALLAVTLAASLSSAPKAASPQKAKELTRRSLKEYDSGDFEKALADATAAFDADPLPALLFNMAQCQRALHRWEQAEFLYHRYLARAPRAKNRKTVEALIAAVQLRQGKTPDSSAPRLPELEAVPLVPGGTAKAPAEADRATAAAAPGFLASDASPVVVVRDDLGPEGGPGSKSRRWAWIATWSAVGLVALGTAAGVVARIDSAAVGNMARPVSASQEPGLAGNIAGSQTFGVAADALWIAGGAGAAAALVLFLTSRREATATTGVTLGPAAAGTGLSVAGRF